MDTIAAALLATLPPHLLSDGQLPKVQARLAVRTAIELGILPPSTPLALADQVDAEIRALVAEDLDRVPLMYGRTERFVDLPRDLQALVVKKRSEKSGIPHLYEYLRVAAMISHLAEPVDAAELTAVNNAA